MSVIITQVMASDTETEDKLNENERKSVNILNLLTNQATECESSQVNLEVIGGSSGSLYSLTESVSIPMSDSYISTDKEAETNDDIDWDAADKLMGNYNGSKNKDAKNQPDLSDTNALSFSVNIFQSEGELTTQKQNRMRSIIRSRIEKERTISGQRKNNESGIFETDRFTNIEQLHEEVDEEGSNKMSEMKGQYFGTPQERKYKTKANENMAELQLEQDRTISENIEEFTQSHLCLDNDPIQGEQKQDTKDFKNKKDDHTSTSSDNKSISEKDLDKEFYTLLDDLVTDLNSSENGISTLDEISKQPTPERRSKTEMKFNLSKDPPFKTHSEDQLMSFYNACPNDACTQTEKMKKVKKCHIL